VDYYVDEVQDVMQELELTGVKNALCRLACSSKIMDEKLICIFLRWCDLCAHGACVIARLVYFACVPAMHLTARVQPCMSGCLCVSLIVCVRMFGEWWQHRRGS